MPSDGPTADELRRKSLEVRLKVADPKIYQEYRQSYLVSQVMALVVFLASFVTGVFLGINSSGMEFMPIFGTSAFGIVIGLIIVRSSKASQILDDFEEEMIRRENRTHRSIEEVKVLNEEALRSRGFNIVAHKNSKIFINSRVVNSFNRIERLDPDMANAIATLVGYVDQSGSPNAVEVVEDLVSEIEGERKSSRIRAYWDYLVKLLPDVAKLSAAGATISKLF